MMPRAAFRGGRRWNLTVQRFSSPPNIVSEGPFKIDDKTEPLLRVSVLPRVLHRIEKLREQGSSTNAPNFVFLRPAVQKFITRVSILAPFGWPQCLLEVRGPDPCTRLQNMSRAHVRSRKLLPTYQSALTVS